MGRAGRFGTKGLALTFVATEEDSEDKDMVNGIGFSLPMASSSGHAEEKDTYVKCSFLRPGLRGQKGSN